MATHQCLPLAHSGSPESGLRVRDPDGEHSGCTPVLFQIGSPANLSRGWSGGNRRTAVLRQCLQVAHIVLSASIDRGHATVGTANTFGLDCVPADSRVPGCNHPACCVLCRAVESLSAGIEAGAMAGIVFYSAGCFASILTTRGHDVRLLMQGVAGGSGLVGLFRRLKKVQTAVRAVALLRPAVVSLGL